MYSNFPALASLVVHDGGPPLTSQSRCNPRAPRTWPRTPSARRRRWLSLVERWSHGQQDYLTLTYPVHGTTDLELTLGNHGQGLQGVGDVVVDRLEPLVLDCAVRYKPAGGRERGYHKFGGEPGAGQVSPEPERPARAGDDGGEVIATELSYQGGVALVTVTDLGVG